MPIEATAPVLLTRGEVAVSVPQADYVAELKPNSTRHEEVFGETFELPPDADTFTLAVDRRGFPPVDRQTELTLKAKAEISFDGGATWELLCAFTTKNGPIYAPRIENGVVVGPGEEIFESSGFCPVRGVGTKRLVRTHIVPIKDARTSLSCACFSLAKAEIAASVERIR